MATNKVKLEGFKDLERTLANLPRATAKNVGKRTLMEAADPIDAAASANAPADTGKLQRTVIVGTRLTRRQQRGKFRESKNYVEVHVGTDMSRGLFTEFGTFKDAPQRWFTAAWEATKDVALKIIKLRLGENIETAAKRYAKKLAKGA